MDTLAYIALCFLAFILAGLIVLGTAALIFSGMMDEADEPLGKFDTDYL